MQKILFIDMNEMAPIFSAEEAKKICDHMNAKFSAFLHSESFQLESGHKGEQYQIKLILSNKQNSFFYPIEAACIPDDEHKDLTPSDIGILMIEYLILYFEEFLSEDRNVYLPIDWSVHHSDDITFFMRGFVRNLKSEQIADELLAQYGHGEQPILPISANS